MDSKTPPTSSPQNLPSPLTSSSSSWTATIFATPFGSNTWTQVANFVAQLSDKLAQTLKYGQRFNNMLPVTGLPLQFHRKKIFFNFVAMQQRNLGPYFYFLWCLIPLWCFCLCVSRKGQIHWTITNDTSKFLICQRNYPVYISLLSQSAQNPSSKNPICYHIISKVRFWKCGGNRHILILIRMYYTDVNPSLHRRHLKFNCFLSTHGKAWRLGMLLQNRCSFVRASKRSNGQTREVLTSSMSWRAGPLTAGTSRVKASSTAERTTADSNKRRFNMISTTAWKRNTSFVE